MNDNNEAYLVKNYPHFYPIYKSPMESAMCWGFPGDGWFQLLKKLSEDIAAVLDKHNLPHDSFEVTQVKEKFGGLRYYFQWNKTPTDGADKEIDALVDAAESLSYQTCEECSAPGKPNEEGWIKTLCPPCEAVRYKSRL